MLPHRPLLQSHVYNSKFGSVMRAIPPLQIDPAIWIDAALRSGVLDTARTGLGYRSQGAGGGGPPWSMIQ
jgi:hypothetical protein